jgi:hypothetical protein
MLGVLLIPTPAFATTAVAGISYDTALAAVTLVATALLWRQRKGRDSGLILNGYALASLALVAAASIVQLRVSPYASLRGLYETMPFWVAGLLLGTLAARDQRILTHLAMVGLPLATLAIVEFTLNKPALWSTLVGATKYDAAQGVPVRAMSTFGHPLVAGAALIVLAFLVLGSQARGRAVLFGVVVAGATATVSRSALVGLGAGLVVSLTTISGRQRAQIMLAVASAACIVAVLLVAIPAFRAQIDARVLGASTTTESVRLNTLQTLEQSFSDGATALFVGRGLEGSQTYLAQTGANLGFGTYDNQYVTSLFDSGLFVVLAAALLIVVAVVRARPPLNRLAPLVTASATFFFFEGLYWPATAVLFWLCVGLATAPDVQSSAPTLIASDELWTERTQRGYAASSRTMFRA